MPHKRLTLGDFVFLAVIGACVTLAGLLTKPLVMAIPIPGIRSMAPAFFYGLFLAIAALKVRKTGSIFLVALFNGVVLLMMSWVMFANNLLAGLLAEAVARAGGKDYRHPRAIVLGAGSYMVFTVPVSFLLVAWAGGEVVGQLVANPWLVLAVLLATAALSFGGAAAGMRIGLELTRAGILRPAVPQVPAPGQDGPNGQRRR